MDEDLGSSYITIEDEDGNEFELEQLATMEYNGQEYSAFLPADMSEDDPDYGYIILRIEEENGEELLSTLDSDEELNAVYDLFMEQMMEDEEDRRPCGVRDESFFNPHFVIRDADPISGLQASRLRFAAGRWKQ